MRTEYVQKMNIGESLNEERMKTEEHQWRDSE